MRWRNKYLQIFVGFFLNKNNDEEAKLHQTKQFHRFALKIRQKKTFKNDCCASLSFEFCFAFV